MMINELGLYLDFSIVFSFPSPTMSIEICSVGFSPVPKILISSLAVANGAVLEHRLAFSSPSHSSA